MTPALAQELRSTVVIQLTDGAKLAYTLSAMGVQDGASDGAGTKVSLSEDTLVELAKTAEFRDLYQHGAIRVDGPVEPAKHLTFFRSLLS